MNSSVTHRIRTAVLLSIRLLGVVLSVLSISGSATAQTNATAASKWQWEQGNTATPADAVALNYKYYVGTSTTGINLSGETCVATVGQPSTNTCQVTIPPFSPGTYSITLTASNAAIESAKSNVLTFTLVVVPATPANLRLIALLGFEPLHLVSKRDLIHWKRHEMTGFMVIEHTN